MYQLVIGLGWNALKTQFQLKYAPIWSRIIQHKVLLNKTICDYYTEKATLDSLDDSIEQYIASIINNHQQSIIDNDIKGGDIKEIFINGLKQYDYDGAIYIYGCNDAKCTNKVPSKIDVDNWSPEDKQNILNMYSVNSIIHLFANSNANKYLRFIRNIICDEETISFIDPFILTNVDVTDALCNTYLPMMKKGSIVNLYIKNTNENQDKLKTRIKDIASSLNIQVHFYYCNDFIMHDRYIVTNDRVLNIGIGLCFYKKKEDKFIVKESVSFNYTSKPTDMGNYEKQLAGKVIESE